MRSAKGAPGVDGQPIADFTEKIVENGRTLAQELREKRYRPQPVKRVEIPKPGGGIRKRGIPSVRDRVVQQVLLDILQPIFDPHFPPSSYGCRSGRSCRQAIGKGTLFVRTHERKWGVDMDLSKCFDTLDHEIILRGFRKRIADGSILNLRRLFLASGVLTGDGGEASEIGSPQGGAISPPIANVYLDEFDQFVKSRNHRIVRYADDIVIVTPTRKAAENALEQAAAFLEGELKLTVNREKTHIVHASEGIKFLGVKIHSGYTQIQDKKIEGFKDKVRGITRRNSPVNLKKVMEDLNPVQRGFANYFRIANCRGVLHSLMEWIRRRLRAKQMALWKKPERLHRRLRQLGYRGEFLKIQRRSWRNAASPLAHKALKNRHLEEMGLYDRERVETGISVSG